MTYKLLAKFQNSEFSTPNCEKLKKKSFAKTEEEENEEFQVENSQMFQLFKFPGILLALDLFSRSHVHYEVQEFSRQKTLLAVRKKLLHAALFDYCCAKYPVCFESG